MFMCAIIAFFNHSPTSSTQGMGFGGLTIALSELFPDKIVLGMEIRPKVTEYVRLRVEGLREANPGQYENASCMRTNCMRYLPNFFRKSQMEKIFICFPDPHFKVTSSLLSFRYTITDTMKTATDEKLPASHRQRGPVRRVRVPP